MKKIIIISLVVFSFAFISHNAFALYSGHIDSSASYDVVGCDNSDHFLSFWTLEDHTFIVNVNCASGGTFADWHTWNSGAFVNVSVIALEISKTYLDCGDYDACSGVKTDYAYITIDYTAPPSTTDPDVTAWGASIAGTAKDNIFKIIGDNIWLITAIFVGIIGIFFVMRLIRKATGR